MCAWNIESFSRNLIARTNMFATKKRLAVHGSVRDPKRLKLVANTNFNQMNMSSMSVSNPGIGNTQDTLLEGILPSSDPRALNQFFRDIYAYDAVSGSAVDLMSTLPFSDWTLTGASEQQIDAYNHAADMLGLKSILPHLSIDYLVLGKFVGTILYRRENREFTDLICHNPDNLDIMPTPLYGADPLITLKVPKDYREFATSKHPYFERVRSRLGQSMVDALKGQRLTLDSLSTLYVPRKTFSNSLGVSLFRRVLPLYLLERMLYRGTLTEAGRRQRSTLHVMAGSEDWEPTEEELSNLVGLFQQADLDPIGAIIATRGDVQTAEIRPAGDFWKYTDVIDITNGLKLKALGISEGFLSGEANYNTAEVALSVFIEHIRTYREMITRRVFYDKVFPLVAVTQGFHKSGSEVAATRGKHEVRKEKMERQTFDTSHLVIPQINWHKQLRPQADQEYIQVLTSMEEKGVPVTIRMWAAAGGISMENWAGAIDEDIQDRKIIAAYKKRLEESLGTSDRGEGEGNDDEFTVSSVLSHAGVSKPIGVLQRDFGEQAEIKGVTKTGKAKYIHNQRGANAKANVEIARALEALADPNRYEQVKNRVKQRLGANPYGDTE